MIRYKEGHWDATQFFASGGLPSSHSATVAALAVAIGIQEGLDSSLFATATIFASIVRAQLQFSQHEMHFRTS